MRKYFLPFLLILASCASSDTKQIEVVIHDIDVDFPTADTITIPSSPIQTFYINSLIGSIHIKDSVIYIRDINPINLGSCYSLNSGNKLSTMINRGNAANEMQFANFEIIGDSVIFINERDRIIKTFSINDILTKPMGNRGFSQIRIPDSIQAPQLIKERGDKIFGVYTGTKNNLDKMYFTIDGNGVSFFGEIREELFEPRDENILTVVKMSPIFHFMRMCNYGDKNIVANCEGISIQIVDSNKKTIDYERHYNKYEVKEPNVHPKSNYGTYSVHCNNEYVFCKVSKRNKVKSKAEGVRIDDNYILVFDWKLNPVKKYYFSLTEDLYRMKISDDCKTFYLLKLEDEKQELFQCQL